MTALCVLPGRTAQLVASCDSVGSCHVWSASTGGLVHRLCEPRPGQLTQQPRPTSARKQSAVGEKQIHYSCLVPYLLCMLVFGINGGKYVILLTFIFYCDLYYILGSLKAAQAWIVLTMIALRNHRVDNLWGAGEQRRGGCKGGCSKAWLRRRRRCIPSRRVGNTLFHLVSGRPGRGQHRRRGSAKAGVAVRVHLRDGCRA